jgi:small subunit ribosomal protein S1
VEPQETPQAPSKIEELKPKMLMKGKVTKLELFGAFIDIGLKQQGLVHISMIKRGHVNRVEDVVQEGQEVDVWVQRVDTNTGRIELTMLEPVQLEWKEIKSGLKAQGKVVRLEKFGAFIDIGAERPGLVHVSEMSNSYVTDPAEIAKVGDTVSVSVLDIDRKKRQIKLTMKEDLAEIYAIDEPEEEEPPTAMEFAIRSALEDTGQVMPEPKKRSRKKSGKKARRELEDILSRTLQERVQTSASESE